MGVYITLDEAKTHMVVDYDDDDVKITGLIDLVEEAVLTEIQGRRKTTEGYVTTNGTVNLVGYGCNFLDYTIGDIIVLPNETPRIIATITTDDTLTVSVAFTLSLANVTYIVYTGLPTLNGALPLKLRQGMLLLIEHYYKNTSATITGVGMTKIPYGFEWLVNPDKNWTVA